MSDVEVTCPSCQFTMSRQGSVYGCECGETIAEERICPRCGAVDTITDVSGNPRAYEKRLFCEVCEQEWTE